MRCYDCGGTYIYEETGTLDFDNYKVNDISYSKCNTCGKILLSSEAIKKIEEDESYIKWASQFKKKEDKNDTIC